MKLDNISKIFGVLAFISFLASIWEMVSTYGSTPKYSFLIMTLIFILSAILTTIKRVAMDMEKK